MDAFEKVRQASQAVRHSINPLQGWLEGSNPEIRQGEQLLEQGKFAEAEQCFLRVVSERKWRSNSQSRRVKSLLALATAQWQQKKIKEAAESAEQARQEMIGAEQKFPVELAECMNLLGSISSEEGQDEKAREFFGAAIEAQKKVYPKDPVKLASRRRRMAEVLSRMGQHNDAWDVLNETYAELAQGVGEDHRAAADCLLELGRCASERGDHEAALSHLNRALKIHQVGCGPDSEEVAQDLQAIAAAYQAAGDLEKSVEAYQKALRLRELQLGGNASEFAVLLMRMAGVQSRMGRYAPAMELLQQAVGKLQGKRDERLATALESLAGLYLNCGRETEAVSCITKAREVWEAAPAKHTQAIQQNSALLEKAYRKLGPERAAELVKDRSADSEEWNWPEFALDSQAAGAAGASIGTSPLAEPAGVWEQPASPPSEFTWPLVAPADSAIGASSMLQPQPFRTEPFAGAPAAAPGFPSAPAGLDPVLADYFSAVESLAGGHLPVAGGAVGSAANLTAPRSNPPMPSASSAPFPLGPYQTEGAADPAPGGKAAAESFSGASQGVHVSFVNPDGVPVEPANGHDAAGPLYLTVMLPEGGLPKESAVTLAPAQNPVPNGAQTMREEEGDGWDDLSFDFLPLDQPRTGD